MENDFTRKLREKLLIFDGAMGTEIYRRHFFVNTSFENLVLTAPDVISEIHRNYVAAGCDVLTTDTFNANRHRLAAFGLADQVQSIAAAAVRLARASTADPIFVAGSVGPLGKTETGTEAELTAALQEQALALEDAAADVILFESLPGIAAVRRAVTAAQALTKVPYILSFVIDGNGISLNGDRLELMLEAALAGASRPAALGLNCGKGPEATLGALEKLRKLTDLPIIVEPNAGEPRRLDGRLFNMNSPEYFTTYALRYAALGAAGIGGCCGIGPEHIAEMCAAVRPLAAGAKRRLPTVVAEVVPQLEKPLAERSRFAAKLAAGEWVTSVELTPPPGFDLSGIVSKAARCRKAGVDVINLPDGPRASSRISSLVTALEIQKQSGMETILHCCCRDRSLIGLQALLLGCAETNVHNLLFITGDPPKLGDFPFSTGVFDLDSIGLIALQKRLNQAIDLGGKAMKVGTSAVIGAGLDPNALDLEREYRRTCEKVEAGAEFIMSQPVFEPQALLKFLKRIEHLRVPVIAGVWPLTSLRNAEFMKTEVPGVVVPDAVITRMAASPDRDAQRACGIAIAREILEAVRGAVQGVQVNAPFGNVETALAVIDPN